MHLGDPQLVSLDAFHHKNKNIYSFRCGDLNNF